MIPVSHIRLLRIMASRLTPASAAADSALGVTAAADPALVVPAAADSALGVTAAADPATSVTAAAADAPSASGIDVASDQSRTAPSLAGRDILHHGSTTGWPRNIL